MLEIPNIPPVDPSGYGAGTGADDSFMRLLSLLSGKGSMSTTQDYSRYMGQPQQQLRGIPAGYRPGPLGAIPFALYKFLAGKYGWGQIPQQMGPGYGGYGGGMFIGPGQPYMGPDIRSRGDDSTIRPAAGPGGDIPNNYFDLPVAYGYGGLDTSEFQGFDPYTYYYGG